MGLEPVPEHVQESLTPQVEPAPQGARRARPAPRYLLLHLPAFALERCGYTTEDVAACVDEIKGATRVVALTPAARALGLCPGMTVTACRALVPDVLLEPHDPVGEAVDRAALLGAFAGFSDRLAPWADADLLLEVSGTAHLFGGEPSLIVQVRERAAALGHSSRVVIGDDPLAASALATWRDGDRVVPPGQGAQALAELPVAALSPSPALAASLEVLGIRRVSTWAALDAASVAGRFGAEGVRLHQIARGLAVSRLPWEPVATGPVSARAVLGGPTITLEPVHFVLPGLLAQLAEDLAQRDAMAVRLAVHLILERGPAHVFRVRVGRATRDPARLEQLVRARLERVRLDAPAVELLLEVEEHTRELTWQPGLLDRSEASETVPDLLARLCDALGEQALVGPVLVDTWRPEAAWAGRAFQPGLPLPLPPPHRKGDDDPVAEQQGFEGDGPRPRPTVLLPRPDRIEVQATGDRPHCVRVEGRWCSVQRAEGPERLEGEWWQEHGGFVRDYWVVGLESSTLWCYLDDQGRWYVHGYFD